MFLKTTYLLFTITFLTLGGCNNNESNTEAKCNFERLALKSADIQIRPITDTTSDLILSINEIGKNIKFEVPYIWDKDVESSIYLRKCGDNSEHFVFLFRPVFMHGYVTYLTDIIGIREGKVAQNNIYSMTLFQVKIEEYENENFELTIVPTFEDEKMLLRVTVDDVIFDRPL